ncbi:MAG: primosomal protein N' [Clostridiales bacterium]|nr:primosomal protein N' [Clostridiales bacterium]
MIVAEVILRESVRQTDRRYSYLIPDELTGYIVPGSYVEVPFGRGNKPQKALVLSVKDGDLLKADNGIRMKSVARLLEDGAVASDLLPLMDEISKRYVCTGGDVVSLMVPSFVGNAKKAKEMYLRIRDREQVVKALEEGTLRSVAHINILEYLLKEKEASKKIIKTTFKASDSQISLLRTKGFIETFQKETDPFGIGNVSEDKDVSSHTDDISSGVFRSEHILNDEQEEACRKIRSAYGNSRVFLLHGITGSGKTEVYLHCAGDILASGGSVIYMVPEISLTPQTVSWINGRFGNTAAVLHSRLTDRQKAAEWNRIKNGEARIVVGPRSSVFAPVKDLAMIIVDEEHDPSYKSETFPRYNAKEIAAMRCRQDNAVLILGSATPSVSSYYAAQKGVYELLTLTKRANPNAVLPDVIPVDMKLQAQEGAGELLSIPLRIAMAEAFSQKKQVMLFLNRRGYSRTLICSTCGSPCECPSCSVGMTLHNNRRSIGRLMICHYCGYTIPADSCVCKECGGTKFTRTGIGTQQLEELLSELYPHEKVLRMDQDSTMRPGAHEEIIGRFRNKEASILIGTQMIAKGHDFPDVTVVGILGADLISGSSDYRSSERCFQLITQASGRAGRSEYKGKVFLQSFKPDAPLLLYSASQDYQAFYDAEIKYRQVMKLPPFKAVGEIMLSLPDEDMLSERVDILSGYLKQLISNQPLKYGFELYGPMQSPIYELRGRYRNSFVIKAVNKSSLNAVFRQLMKDFDPSLYPISFDNDTSGI